MNTGLLAAILYIIVFVIAAFRAEKFQWLWSSVFVWFGISMLGAALMPEVWGITHVGPLFIPHFYITIGSLFLFVNEWGRLPQPKMWRLGNYDWLGLFAISNLLMTLAFAVLLWLIWYCHPNRITVFAWPALLKMYALQPLYWFAPQAIIMGIFYVHRRIIEKQPACWFSYQQLQAGFFLALLFQFVELILIMLEVNN